MVLGAGDNQIWNNNFYLVMSMRQKNKTYSGYFNQEKSNYVWTFVSQK